jgi:hypothetical protein
MACHIVLLHSEKIGFTNELWSTLPLPPAGRVDQEQSIDRLSAGQQTCSGRAQPVIWQRFLVRGLGYVLWPRCFATRTAKPKSPFLYFIQHVTLGTGHHCEDLSCQSLLCQTAVNVFSKPHYL